MSDAGSMDLRKGEPTGAYRGARHLERRKGGGNRRGRRRQKQAHGAGLQSPIGTLGSRLRAARKIIDRMGGGGQREGEISRWIFDLIPEERGEEVGCNIVVKLRRTMGMGGRGRI